MDLMAMALMICAVISLGLVAAGAGMPVRRLRKRQPRQLAHDEDWNDQNRPKKLNYNYIDWLERDLKVGKYDPDRIALGFDDTEQKPKPKPKPKPLDPEVDDLPMPGAVEVNERCPCVACRSKRRDTEYLGRVAKAKPVDDSWADVDVRDGVYGPKTRGLVRRIVDNNGNWSEIRSFGS